MLTADTNLFIHAADPDSIFHDSAKRFFQWVSSEADDFVVCELVLVEVYILLRNPSVFKKPYTATEAAGKHFEDFGFQKVWNPLEESGGRIAND